MNPTISGVTGLNYRKALKDFLRRWVDFNRILVKKIWEARPHRRCREVLTSVSVQTRTSGGCVNFLSQNVWYIFPQHFCRETTSLGMGEKGVVQFHLKLNPGLSHRNMSCPQTFGLFIVIAVLILLFDQILLDKNIFMKTHTQFFLCCRPVVQS